MKTRKIIGEAIRKKSKEIATYCIVNTTQHSFFPFYNTVKDKKYVWMHKRKTW